MLPLSKVIFKEKNHIHEIMKRFSTSSIQAWLRGRNHFQPKDITITYDMEKKEIIIRKSENSD